MIPGIVVKTGREVVGKGAGIRGWQERNP